MTYSQTETVGASSVADRYLVGGTVAAPIEAASSSEGFLNLPMIRAMAWRQRYIVASVVALGLVVGAIITLLATPVYQATATLRADSGLPPLVEGQEVFNPYLSASELSREIETLTEVAQSRNMALRVVDALDLTSDAAFLDGAGEALEDETEAARADRVRNESALILQGSVEVTAPPGGRIVTIEFMSVDARRAAQIANGYADALLVDNVEQDVQSNAYAREYLEEEISSLRQQVRDAEIAAIEYARANGIVAQDIASPDSTDEDGAGQTIILSTLSAINDNYTAARARRLNAEERWRAAEGTPALQLSEAQTSSNILALRSELSTLNAQLANLTTRYQDDYPEIVELRAQIETLEGGLESVARDIKQAIRNEYLVAQRQERALSEELSRISAESLDEQDRRVQYSLLDREASALRVQLAVLLDRFNQITSAARIQSSDLTMLDRARAPRSPASPNLLNNMLIALLLSLVVAAVLGFLREVFDDRLRAADDVERRLRIPLLGQVPYTPDDIEGELNNHFSPVGEAYSSLRATLQYHLSGAGAKVVQFTSSEAAEGKTTSIVALAECFARVGQRVLLIDCDLRRPALRKHFEAVGAKIDLFDVIHNRAELNQAKVATDYENLDVLTVNSAPDDPINVLSSGLIPQFLNHVKSQYDIILIDSSPVLGIADAPLLSRHSDAVVFVAEANRVHSGRARHALKRLRDVNANVIGCLLTKYRALESGESYNYQYKYYSYSSEG